MNIKYIALVVALFCNELFAFKPNPELYYFEEVVDSLSRSPHVQRGSFEVNYQSVVFLFQIRNDSIIGSFDSSSLFHNCIYKSKISDRYDESNFSPITCINTISEFHDQVFWGSMKSGILPFAFIVICVLMLMVGLFFLIRQIVKVVLGSDQR